MKSGFLIVLTFISLQLQAQVLEKLRFEQLAIDYFADSIAPQLHKFRIVTDGSVFNRGIDKDYIKRTVNEFYNGVLQQNHDNKNVYKKYWAEYEKVLMILADTIKLIRVDSINYHGNRLSIKHPLVEKKSVKYKELKGGFLRFHGKKVYNFLFRDRYILGISRQVYFDNKHWVRIRMDRPDLEYGQYYILRFNKEGNLIDFSETEWIQ